MLPGLRAPMGLVLEVVGTLLSVLENAANPSASKYFYFVGYFDSSNIRLTTAVLCTEFLLCEWMWRCYFFFDRGSVVTTEENKHFIESERKLFRLDPDSSQLHCILTFSCFSYYYFVCIFVFIFSSSAWLHSSRSLCAIRCRVVRFVIIHLYIFYIT